uniref:Ig-like domain-containing protein n=1 Tax=Hucho hucho TaxID=62062 RepID=A0A4W5JN38_9TELE
IITVIQTLIKLYYFKMDKICLTNCSVHSGENVTLQCINVLRKHGQVGWFKQVNSTEPLCITSMWSSLPAVHHQNGFQVKHMKMFMTNGTIFLKITEVDVTDSGLYFCGMSENYFIFTNATVLKVQKIKYNSILYQPSLRICIISVADPQMRILVLLSITRTGVLLCCLTIFIIIYLIRK